MNKKMKILVYSVITFAVVGVLFTANFAVKSANTLFSRNNYSMRDNRTHMQSSENSSMYKMMNDNNNSHCN